MDVPSILTGGGVVGLLAALAYVGRLALDWKKEQDGAPIARTTAAVSDAATANATLVKTLEAISEENRRQAAKIKHLEEEAAVKDAKIDELESRLNEIAAELAALKTH